MAEVKRSVKIGERIREELASLIAREVRDPRVLGVSVTAVVMTDDLQLAKVRVRHALAADESTAANANAEAQRRKSLLVGLDSASGLLRREIGKRLGLRYAPKLVFHYDESHEKRSRVDELLDEIARSDADDARKRE